MVAGVVGKNIDGIIDVTLFVSAEPKFTITATDGLAAGFVAELVKGQVTAGFIENNNRVIVRAKELYAYAITGGDGTTNPYVKIETLTTT